MTLYRSKFQAHAQTTWLPLSEQARTVLLAARRSAKTVFRTSPQVGRFLVYFLRHFAPLLNLRHVMH